MKQKFNYLIILFLIGISSYSQTNKNDWKLFVDKEIGYSIEYPKNWIAKGGKGGFMCGKESGFTNAEWTMWLSKPENTERIDFIFNDKELYKDYKITKRPISINGVNGLYSLITHKEKPNEYIEYIVIKTESIWYKIENSGIKDNEFESFYKSFKITK